MDILIFMLWGCSRVEIHASWYGGAAEWKSMFIGIGLQQDGNLILWYGVAAG